MVITAALKTRAHFTGFKTDREKQQMDHGLQCHGAINNFPSPAELWFPLRLPQRESGWELGAASWELGAGIWGLGL